MLPFFSFCSLAPNNFMTMFPCSLNPWGSLCVPNVADRLREIQLYKARIECNACYAPQAELASVLSFLLVRPIAVHKSLSTNVTLMLTVWMVKPQCVVKTVARNVYVLLNSEVSRLFEGNKIGPQGLHLSQCCTDIWLVEINKINTQINQTTLVRKGRSQSRGALQDGNRPCTR